MMQVPTTAGRGGWRGHPETSRAGPLAFAVNARSGPPSSMLGANSNHLSTASPPSAALSSTGRALAVLRSFPCEGGSRGDDSGPRRRRVRARGGSAVCMMAQQQKPPQRKAKPPPVSAAGRVRVGAAAAAAPAPALENSREMVTAIYACEGRGRSYAACCSRLKSVCWSRCWSWVCWCHVPLRRVTGRSIFCGGVINLQVSHWLLLFPPCQCSRRELPRAKHRPIRWFSNHVPTTVRIV